MHRTYDAIKQDPNLTQEQAAFAAQVMNHDLTYSYSDDGRTWKAGQASYDAIKAAAKNFDRTFVVEVWNACVDRKIVPTSREYFYWKVEA